MITHRRRQIIPAIRAPSPSVSGDSAPNSSIEVVDTVVPHLFTVSLTLASCLAIVPPAVSGRLEQAINELDQVIREMKVAVSSQSHVDRRIALGPPSANALEIDAAVEALRAAANQIYTVARSEPATGSRMIPLLDAAHSACRAVLILEQASLPE